MILGDIIIIACPHCYALMYYRSLLSGNTMGARHWTDGKVVAPMLPRLPDFVACCGCGRPYWRNDAAIVTSNLPGQLRESDLERLNVSVTEEPTESGYLEAIAEGTARTRDEERALRLWALWKRNDNVRYCAGEPDLSLARKATQNLETLAELFDENGPPVEKLLKAEMLRELGRFEEALRILLVFNRHRFNGRRDFQISLCDQRNSAVCKIPRAAFESVKGRPPRR